MAWDPPRIYNPHLPELPEQEEGESDDVYLRRLELWAGNGRDESLRSMGVVILILVAATAVLLLTRLPI